MLGSDRAERLAQPLVELDHVERPDVRRQRPAQHPLPPADLEHDLVARERRVAHDRSTQVRVGQEVLPEPHHPNTRAAFASTIASSSS